MELKERSIREKRRGAWARTPVIDVDVHEGFESVQELLPYLQHISQELDRLAVSCVLEEAQGVFGCDRKDGRAQRVDECLAGAGRGPAQEEGLDLGEGFFDGIQIGRVGRQVKQSSQPRASINSLTLAPLWAARLSITTTCPGCRLGASTRST